MSARSLDRERQARPGQDCSSASPIPHRHRGLISAIRYALSPDFCVIFIREAWPHIHHPHQVSRPSSFIASRSESSSLALDQVTRGFARPSESGVGLSCLRPSISAVSLAGSSAPSYHLLYTHTHLHTSIVCAITSQGGPQVLRARKTKRTKRKTAL